MTGVFASIVNALSIAFDIASYYIWSYKGITPSIKTIFTLLQTYRLGGLISVDIWMLLFAPIKILMILAIYASQNLRFYPVFEYHWKSAIVFPAGPRISNPAGGLDPA